MRDILSIDGAHGEGGGQILRTALSLSVISARPIRLANIRAARPKPGLAPQHLSAVRAAAIICGADISGDILGSTELTFVPGATANSGDYVFDIAEEAGRGSAGSVSLVLQTLLIPLALTRGASRLVLRGGTHVEWSPSFDFLAGAYLPILRKMAFRVDAQLTRWGWYPFGNGEIVCKIEGGPSASDRNDNWPRPLHASERGNLRRISGRAVAANLPEHIPARMAERARAALDNLGVPVDIRPESVTAACAGAGIFLLAEYEGLAAGFSALGRRGKPAEVVADQAVAALREHHRLNVAAELHLADQLLLPLAVAASRSEFTVERPTAHLATNAWVVNQFGVADVRMEGSAPCRVAVDPIRAKKR
jgi:RNA 3'-terminal phosphate cyclase (ATP)